MSNFTKGDFNTIMNYIEYKIQTVREDKFKQVSASQSALQNTMFERDLQGWYYLLRDVERDFCYGVFKDE